jgi:hypothetical protein
VATAARISIQLDAQTAEIRQGFSDVRREIGDLSGGMSNAVATGMAKFHLALAGIKAALAAVKNLIGNVSESMNRLADMGDFAQRIGVGVEALQALRYAAEQNGASAGVMDMALQRLTRRVSQAAAGTGELAKILPEIGLNAQEMNRLKPDEQFRLFADAVAGAATRGDQMRLAMAALDTEGVALVDMLSKGSAAIEQFGKEAVDTGIASADLTERAQAAAAATLRWNQAWQNFKDVIAGYVLPAITAILKGLTWLINKLRWIWDWGGKGTASSNPLEPLSVGAKKAATSLDPVVEKVEKVAAATSEATRRTIDLKTELEKVAEVKTPNIGAVTRMSAGGFSAAQAAQRTARDKAKHHAELMIMLAKILHAAASGTITIAPVKI